MFRLLLGAAVIAVLLTGCGGETRTEEIAGGDLVRSYEEAGVQFSEAERACLGSKVPDALSESDKDARELRDLSMDSRIRVARVVKDCVSGPTMKQIYERVVAGDADLPPTVAACLAKALVDKKVDYVGLVGQQRKPIETLGSEARRCLGQTS